MKSVLLIGLGRFGRSIAEKLNEMHHQIMAVDRDESRVNDILPLVTDAQIGDSREVHRKFLLRNGADDVVYPEKQLAAWTAVRHTTDLVQDYIALDEEYAIYDLSVPAEWNGKTVGGLDIRKKYNLNLLAVRKNGHPSIAVTSETVLQENQTILVLGTWKDIQKCFRL